MNGERRGYRRHPVHWEATLYTRGAETWPAAIEDVCAGGLFLAVDAAPDERQLSERSPVRLRFHDPLSDTARTLWGHIARRTPTGVGMSFDAPHPDVVTLLRAVGGTAAPAAELPVPAQAAPGAHDRGHWLRELCRGLAEPFLTETLPAFAAELIDELFNRSRSAAEPAEQDLLFQAYRRLRGEQSTIPARFTERFLQRLEQLGAAGAAGDGAGGAANTSPELELVDEREFEDWLQRSEVIGRAEARQRRPLGHLQRRLAAVLDEPAGTSANPLAPESLAGILGDAVSLGRLPLPAVRAVYHVFGRVVLDRLGVVYERLNAALKNAGYLPDAEQERPEIHMLGGASERAGEAPASSPATGASAAARHADGDEHTRAHRPGDASRLADLAATLEGLAREAPTTSAKTIAPADGLAERLDPASGSRRHAAARVDSWFARVTADSATPEFLRHWSGRLALLALDEQLRDGRFLAGTDSALNRLINQVDRAGVALSTLAPGAREELREELEAWLHRAHREGSPQVLDAAATAVAERIAAPLQARAANMQRVLQQCEGAQRLERARQAVAEAVGRRVDGRRIPQPVAAFLETGWSDLLTLIHLRHGSDNDTWRRCLAVVDRLLLALGRDDTPAQPIRDPDRVLEYARHQLQQYGRLTPEIKPLLGELASAVSEVCGTGTLREPPTLTAMPVPATDSPGAGTGIDALWIDRARLLQPGDWVMFSGADETPEPLRLQWTDEHRNRFVFVNRAGRKSRELSASELAGQLRASAQIVDDLDAPFTERQWRRTLEHAHDALVRQATHDPLTGLYNRKAFIRALERLPDHAGVDGYALLLLSLDGFSDVSARLGQTAGDRLRRRVGRLMRRAGGELGAAARIGGGEFAVVIDRADDAAARLLAERLRRSVARLPATAGGAHAPITATAGVLPFRGEDLVAPQLLQTLEDALRRACRESGDRLIALPRQTHVEDADQAYLTELLDRALDDGVLSLRAQRIQPLAGQQDTHQRYELFAALRDRRGEQLLMPARFLPVARQRGRMPRLDRTMLGHGMTLASRLARRDGHATTVHVNLSAASLTEPAVMQTLERLHGADAQEGARLCLEIPEAVAARMLSATVRFAERARSLGCEVCLDSFGTALATYDFLKTLPVDLFKLDGQFVQQLDGDDSDRAMVRAITELAHLLDRRTIAAQVERSELITPLRESGVDFIQGYAIERTQPLR